MADDDRVFRYLDYLESRDVEIGPSYVTAAFRMTRREAEEVIERWRAARRMRR